MNNPIIGVLLVIVAAFCGITLGAAIGRSDYIFLIISAVVLSGIFWVALARQAWWAIVPAATMLAGSFQVGFKVYPHEFALAVSLLAVIPLVVFQTKHNRGSIPLPLIALLIYLSLHCFGSLAYAKLNNLGGTGNIIRSYAWGLWPLIFSVIFLIYGNAKHLFLAFVLIFLVGTAQLGGTLLSVAIGAPVVIPGINYVLSASGSSGESSLGLFEYRWAAVNLLVLSLCLLTIRGFFVRITGLAATTISIFLLISGGGRAAAAVGGLYICLWLAAMRYRMLLIGGLITFTLFVLTINTAPNLLSHFPYQIERALSAFVLDKGHNEELFGGGAGSDDWHAYLREIGFERWTTNGFTLVFGYGTRPTELLPTLGAFSRPQDVWYSIAESAANTGSYEKTFWTVLAVTGLVGLVLYSWLFCYYLRALWPYVKERQPKTLKDFTVWWGFAGIVITIVSSPIAGGFPGFSLMMATLALSIVREKKSEPPPTNKLRAIDTPHTSNTLDS